jgi:hypothetical protein
MEGDRDWVEEQAKALDLAVSRGWGIDDWLNKQGMTVGQIADIMQAYTRLRKEKTKEGSRRSPGAYD